MLKNFSVVKYSHLNISLAAFLLNLDSPLLTPAIASPIPPMNMYAWLTWSKENFDV